MIMTPNKEYFPLLPFDKQISYFKIESNETIAQNFMNDSSIKKDCQEVSRKKMKKTIIKMSEAAIKFKYSFYNMFTTRKKFPKKYVCKIHNEICNSLKLDKINRDETRSIDLYFFHYAEYGKRILLHIEKNKFAILQKFPELLQFLH